MPRAASDAFELRRDEQQYVDARLLGATESAGLVAEGYVIYPDAYGPGNHVLHRGMADGVEDFVSFDRRPSEPAVEYSLQIGQGVKGLRLVSDTLEFLDGDGYPIMRVAPPSIVDADGADHPARMAMLDCAFDADPRVPWGRKVTPPGRSACHLRIEWDDAEMRYPALLDPSWTTTASMAQARTSHTATQLPNGDVVVAGGGYATAEVYSRTAHVWTATGAMTMARTAHSANLLGNGDVLVLGGYATNAASSETYSPATGLWTAAGNMPSARAAHASIELPNGSVLATGGINSANSFSYDALTALYDPNTRTWLAAPPMTSSRALHALTALPDGRILASGGSVSGGSALTSCEIYSPSANTWTATGSMTTARYSHAVAAMHTGSILVAGGYGGGQFLASAETFNPSTGTWTNRAAMAQGRSGATATRAPNGAILVVGGYSANTFFNTTEAFNPTAMTWSAGSAMVNRRGSHRTLSFEGVLLVAGGRQENNVALNTAELIDLTSAPSFAGYPPASWNDPNPPTNEPPRTRILNNPPSFVTNPCYPAGSCPTISVGPFIEWASGAFPEEDEVIRTRLTQERGNSTVVTQFCQEANNTQNDWSRRVVALALLGSMRSSLAESCLTQFVNQALPTTGPTVTDSIVIPDNTPVAAGALAMLQALAADGLALLPNTTARAEVRRLAKDHPSSTVRAEAMRAYISNYGTTGRQELLSVVRPEELILLDRFENRDPDWDTKMQTFLTQHPEADQAPAEPLKTP